MKKAIGRRRWYDRWKRSGRSAAGDPATASARLGRTASPDEAGLLARAVSKEPVPELSAILREQLERLLEALTDPVLHQIAEWRMEGASNTEIARRLGCAIRTIEASSSSSA